MGNGEWGMGNEGGVESGHKASGGRAGLPTTFPIIFIGDRHQAEVRELADRLSESGAVIARDVSAALTWINGDFTPALIVLAFSSPGCISLRQIEQLRRAAPLARLIEVQGPWLEGETRTGRPLPAVERIRWHNARRIIDQLELLRTKDSYAWSAPVTAGNDDRQLAAAMTGASDIRSPGKISIAIVARHRETAQALADVCARCGWQSKWLRSGCRETPLHGDVILFDALNGEHFEFDAVAKLHTDFPFLPIVVLQGFPRLHEILGWKQAGAAAVVSKPFLVDDLIGQVQSLLAKQLAAAS